MPAGSGWWRLATRAVFPCRRNASDWRHDVGWRDLDADLTDPATVARVIGPVEEFVGPATLAFLDPTAVDIGDDPRVAAVAAGHESVRQLAAACGTGDAEESGILAVESSVAVWQVAGRVVAASGYQVWHGQLGHLSVLVAPGFRGRGLGKAVAARAVGQVVEAGLVPQWRARSTLVTSRRIARSLGFVELGRQATYRLDLARVRPPPLHRCPLQLIGRCPDQARAGIECGEANAGTGAVGTADDCHGDGGGPDRGGGPGRLDDRPGPRAAGGRQEQRPGGRLPGPAGRGHGGLPARQRRAPAGGEPVRAPDPAGAGGPQQPAQPQPPPAWPGRPGAGDQPVGRRRRPGVGAAASATAPPATASRRSTPTPSA